MKQEKTFHGVVVPLVSPLNEDLSVDSEGLSRLVDLVVSAGAAPFLLGTTGEASSLDAGQKNRLVEFAVKTTGGRCPVFAGISGNCLPESLEAAKRYAGYGTDVVVAHLPSYYPMDQVMALRYFDRLAKNSPLPVILYNIPSTTHYSIPLEVIEELSYHPNVAGIKDSEQSKERMEKSLQLWKYRTDFSYFMGSAALSAVALLGGADGIVPSAANMCPEWYIALYRAAREGEHEKALHWQEMTDKISLLYQKGFNLSHSLAALKTLMSKRNQCKPFVMPPLVGLTPAEESLITSQTELLKIPDNDFFLFDNSRKG